VQQDKFTMKRFGINTFVWVSPSTTEAIVELMPHVKKLGFDFLEISFENPELINVDKISESLKQNGLSCIICGVFGADRNLCSSEEHIRENAKKYIQNLIDAAVKLDSPLICGPMYSAVGKVHLDDESARSEEWQRAVSGIREMADYAKPKNIKLALEIINRFETDMLNVVSQGLDFIKEVDRENVGLHLDTFHMHLEEKNSADAIRNAGNKLFHFHACENDRGVPGSGQVHWNVIAQALKDINYTGPVVIESFTPQVKEISQAVCIWREIAPSQDAIAQQGLKFLQGLLVP